MGACASMKRRGRRLDGSVLWILQELKEFLKLKIYLG
jgi:hypothetical protein